MGLLYAILPPGPFEMTSVTMRLAGLAIMLSAGPVRAAEPILGRWVLASQEVSGRGTPRDDLMLRVRSIGQTLEFAYSVPVNDIQFVSLRFASRLDGTQADVTDANGKKIGTVKVVKAGNSQYKITLQGQNKPVASGTMTVSADGKTLTSESESTPPGQSAVVRMVQIFSRQ
jgi:secreted protein with Ig-like and vWFA domain